MQKILVKGLNEDYLRQLEAYVLKMKKKFDDAAGFSPLDEQPPRFFIEEQLLPSGNVFDVPVPELKSV